MDIESCLLMARYNIWANHRLSHILAIVIDDDFFNDHGLFFNSIFGTLNHLLLCEHYLWFPRFAQAESPTLALDQIIEPDRDKLIQALVDNSKRWLDLLQAIDPATLNKDLSYITSQGQMVTLPYGTTLMHVFNHATHHRGQITAALTKMGYPTPELDLVYMLLEEQSNSLI